MENGSCCLLMNRHCPPKARYTIHRSTHAGIYDDLRSSLSSMLHTSLKTSDDLQYAMLTGIQRVVKENVFSDLNNLLVCTVKDKEYAEYFGFKKAEVEQILHAYDYEYNTEIQNM